MYFIFLFVCMYMHIYAHLHIFGWVVSLVVGKVCVCVWGGGVGDRGRGVI